MHFLSPAIVLACFFAIVFMCDDVAVSRCSSKNGLQIIVPRIFEAIHDGELNVAKIVGT